MLMQIPHCFTLVFEVVLLGPAVEDQVDDLRRWSLAIIGQNARLHAALQGMVVRTMSWLIWGLLAQS